MCVRSQPPRPSPRWLRCGSRTRPAWTGAPPAIHMDIIAIIAITSYYNY